MKALILADWRSKVNVLSYQNKLKRGPARIYLFKLNFGGSTAQKAVEPLCFK